MPRTTTTRNALLPGVLAAVVAAMSPTMSPASAQTVQQNAPRVITKSETVVSTHAADGTRIEVRMENGNIASLRMNGKDVPTDRVRRVPDGFEILGDDGEVVQRLPVQVKVAGPMPRDGARAVVRPAQPVEAALPKSMIGVGFGQVDEALAHHLGIDAAKSTMVSGLVDGMPAQKAGIEKFDVIVGVDGKTDASLNEVRKAVASAEPGTKLAFTVRRGAETKQFEIETAAFDAAKLSAFDGSSFPWQAADGEDAEVELNGGGSRMFFIGPDGKHREITIPGVSGLMPEMPRFDSRDFDELRRTTRELLERMQQQMREQFGGNAEGDAQGDEIQPPAPPAQQQRAAPRGAQRRGPDAAEDRLRRMEERMEDLRREIEREREARRGERRPADA